MAAKLEASTKQYGCLVLISQAMISLISEDIADECRMIDHVKLPGSREPFKLYTLDLDDLALEVERAQAVCPGQSANLKPNKYRQRHERQRLKNERWSDDFKLHSMFEGDQDIVTMRAKFTSEFFCRFNMAYLNYEAGEWLVAKDMLEATRFFLATEDGPSAALLRYMRTYNWTAPKDWNGSRILGDK
eukprot:TRINITY_DN7737_c0_g1_i6.p1 TRINITY_DN7737_c0_g1~~TRINITY_DN7737_c0_g1_i6.p1  ORF type:complete len:209 (+),score=27.78 TRINITY_DN7737_c0_g1_i6:64-627(+)